MGWEFDVYGDPSNAFVKKLREMDLVHPVISGSNGDEAYKKAKHPLTDHQYPNGMVQPAILILQGSTDKVLFSWNIDPNAMNMGGASDRPEVEELWDATKKKMAGKLDKIEISNLNIVRSTQLPLYYALVSTASFMEALWTIPDKWSIIANGKAFIAALKEKEQIVKGKTQPSKRSSSLLLLAALVAFLSAYYVYFSRL
mmetsp:Transcript_11439/g.13114  ORF Transcript_11439/g.13114 Transcript_11439/m.13114 type:complete len:199 (-) Transcript_11439:829-1425(-)